MKYLVDQLVEDLFNTFDLLWNFGERLEDLVLSKC